MGGDFDALHHHPFALLCPFGQYGQSLDNMDNLWAQRIRAKHNVRPNVGRFVAISLGHATSAKDNARGLILHLVEYGTLHY